MIAYEKIFQAPKSEVIVCVITLKNGHVVTGVSPKMIGEYRDIEKAIDFAKKMAMMKAELFNNYKIEDKDENYPSFSKALEWMNDGYAVKKTSWEDDSYICIRRMNNKDVITLNHDGKFGLWEPSQDDILYGYWEILGKKENVELDYEHRYRKYGDKKSEHEKNCASDDDEFSGENFLKDIADLLKSIEELFE